MNIAKMLGKKDHTTIIHGANKIEDELKNNLEIKNRIETIRKTLGA